MRRIGDMAWRSIAAIIIVLMIWIGADDPPPPPPPPCWEDRLARMEGKPGIAGANECPPQPPTPAKSLSPKADIATLRHDGLFEPFFDDPATSPIQRRIVAAELVVDYRARVDAFTELAVEATTPALVWRAEIALAFTHLRYGENEAARAAAARALATVDDGKLAAELAADAQYVLALTASEPTETLSHLRLARQSDPFYFDANLRLLAVVARLLRETRNPEARLALLDEGLLSIDYLRALDDRGLLVELQLGWPQRGMSVSAPEEALLDAYVLWYSGRIDEAKAIVEPALAACRIESQICQRLKGFDDVVRRAG